MDLRSEWAKEPNSPQLIQNEMPRLIWTKRTKTSTRPQAESEPQDKGLSVMPKGLVPGPSKYTLSLSLGCKSLCFTGHYSKQFVHELASQPPSKVYKLLSSA